MEIDAEDFAIKAVHARLSGSSNVNWIRNLYVDSEYERREDGSWFFGNEKLFLDVAASLSAAKVRVDTINARSTPDGYATVFILLTVRDRYELDTVIRKLDTVSGVMTVSRGKG